MLIDFVYFEEKEELIEETDAPINKDEMLLKAYCIHILDETSAKKLIKEREEMYLNKYLSYEKKISDFKEQYGGVLKTTDSPYFGRFVILNKILGDAKWGMQWCQWIYSFYEGNQPINVFEHNPFI